MLFTKQTIIRWAMANCTKSEIVCNLILKINLVCFFSSIQHSVPATVVLTKDLSELHLSYHTEASKLRRDINT